MSQTYQARRRAQDAPAAREFQTSVPGPSMQELAAGAMPSTEQMGHRVDLPNAIREKMESSFGADFSGVKVYESQTVADAGAQAMTMGSNVAFAPGQLDFTSTSGQALLGHELSHVVSQARGESVGRGFLADSGLEAQADRQGAMAARGESVYGGGVAPLSASAVSASTGGVAQAQKQKDIANDALKAKGAEPTEAQRANKEYDEYNHTIETYALQTNLDSMAQHEPSLRMTQGEVEHRLAQQYSNSGYLRRKLAQTKDEREQRAILGAFVSGDQEKINNYIRNDALALTQGMTDASSRMNSEDFKTRADAYAGSGAQTELAYMLDGVFDLESVLNERELTELTAARENFNRDLEMTHHSMLAHATEGNQGNQAFYNSKKQRALRKAYREGRRNGKAAKGL